MGRVMSVLGGMATYVALLGLAVFLAIRMAKGAKYEGVCAAVHGVWFATLVNLFVFSLVEHGYLKRMNEDK